MSIKGEIEKTASYLRSARKAILGRGGEISPTAGLKDFSSAIYNIPADTSLAFITDDAVAYRKVVPENASPYARVDSVGGMSYKTKNLIPYPYYNGTQTNNGITFTVNADGTITANGSNNATSLSALLLMLKPLAEGTYTYSFVNIPPDGVYGSASLYKNGSWVKTLGAFTGSRQQKSFTFTITEEEANYDVGLNYAVTAGYSVSNYTAYPMLNEGETALPYEPYFEGIRSAKVTELVSEGANLFDISKALNDVLVDNGDGTYTITNKGNVNGTDSRFSKKVPLFIPANTSFTSKGVPISGTKASFTIGFADTSLDRSITIDGNARTHTYANDVTCIQIYYPFQYGKNSETFADFQIEYGTVATEYKPYVGTIATKPIPEALRNFLEDKGYGLGIDATYNNYIDFERKKFVQKCKEIDLSSLTFVLLSSTEQKVSFRAEIADLYKTSSQTEIPLLLCAQYKTVWQQGTWYVGDISQAHNTNMIYINEAPNTSLEEFTEKTKGVKLVYGLAEAIEIDISAYLTGDSFIEVQGGGTITAVNEYEYAVPSEIKYIQRVGG